MGKIVAGLCAALALAAGRAQAATWIVTYASAGGAPLSASLTVQTADTLDAVGGLDITGVTGAVDGDAVTGLILNPGQPFAHLSADGLFIYDNVLFATGAPVFSNPGLFFSGASGSEYNLFSDNASTYELYRARSGTGYLAHSRGAVTLARAGLISTFGAGGGAVPEPAAWALTILGLGAVGAVMRRRRSLAAT
ncbi:PEPxxWA-CTERM sorting domain-containing protein [Phenylobacterium sp.]|uniref:PEPxxWA-CTERM sorting domain-containing protein n=1 Tax=Phenylobacterium sp. TaxID=1871053 RepID=UPI00286BF8E1|nr:PEPxxWA-CTERM sorting domain-containing protein [Phenylobacterium sp.]